MKLSNLFKSLLLSAAICLSLNAFAEDVKLPNPQITGGKGIYQALKERKTTSFKNNAFPTNKPSLQELSNLLWAATGRNRPEQDWGWTIPYVKKKPYARVYVACEHGVALYDPENHSLKKVLDKNIKGLVGKQSEIANTPLVLIIVSNGDVVDANPPAAKNWPYVASGAMAQGVYLASADMGLAAHYVGTIQHDVIKKELSLPDNDVPINLITIGKK